MSELSSGLRTSLRVVRTVRRSESVGGGTARGIEGGAVDPTTMSAGGLAVLITALSNPYLAGLVAAILVASISEQFYQPGIGFVLPVGGQVYADTVRQALLVHIYGPQEGNKIWNYEFGTRQTEIDLRSKYPG